MLGYMDKIIQTPMAQGRSTKIIKMIKWIRNSRLSIKNFLFVGVTSTGTLTGLEKPPRPTTDFLRRSVMKSLTCVVQVRRVWGLGFRIEG